MNQAIIAAGAVAGAILSIVALIKLIIVPIVKAVKKKQELDKRILASLENNERHNLENYIAILKLTIVNEDMPLEERLEAGHIYVDVLHKNGQVHLQYELLKKQWYEIHGCDYEPKG